MNKPLLQAMTWMNYKHNIERRKADREEHMIIPLI